ncbi:alpha/beta hydrolase [Cohnella pontilimi]|uniref:Alpha/beta hydrolase n=1 Tax=Cohnella pontilimi TaxID=2564100 RepID=A0A4U0F9J6_9BACL|nr:alpha/beta hydrolase [Cohnella pontilimi]TJY39782.1 alpha/beta hydrolase [Cohnella pontilimi]
MPMIHVNGVDLHYHLQGKGVPIVFLHPPCIGSRVFTYLRNDLSQDYRTLMFDFRGHGHSGTSGTRLTIPLLVEDTRQLMDALDISSAYLCTYSMASMVALEALLTHPNRFSGAVLLGGLAKATGWRLRGRLRAGSIASRWGARDSVAAPILWVNSDNTQTYRNLRRETLSGDVAKWREYFDSGLRYSAENRLPEIKQPVLLVCGEKDRQFHKHMRTMKQGLPNASTAFIRGKKHFLPTYAADPIAGAIRLWLEPRDEKREDQPTPGRPPGPDTWMLENRDDPEPQLRT